MFDPMKWFINSSGWVRWGILGPLFVGMLLWIWYLSSEEEKHEATLLTVCWSDGQAHYPDTEQDTMACPTGVKLLKWPGYPKTVRWDFPKDFDTYRRSHLDAMAWVSNELGIVALIETDSAADITIVWGSFNEGTGLMNTRHFKEGDTIRAVITVRKPGDIREWMLEEKHELLHALGLAHDRRGIMSKSLAEPDGQKAWLLHKRDRKALRDL